MKERLVFGTTNMNDFEVLFADENFYGRQLIERKTLSAKDIIEILKIGVPEEERKIATYNNLDGNILYIEKTTQKETITLKFEEQYIRTHYQGQYYKILHPRSVIKITVENEQIRKMAVYAYKVWEGSKTVLYKNPMPNGYSNGDVCIGSIDKTCKDYVKDTIRIMEGSYTHTGTGLKGELANTKAMFEYLQTNPFPYDQLKKENLTLDKLVKGN